MASVSKLDAGKPPVARRELVLKRMLATVLFLDIVGSTERAAALGDQRWRSLLERYRAVTRKEIGRYGGGRSIRQGMVCWPRSTLRREPLDARAR